MKISKEMILQHIREQGIDVEKFKIKEMDFSKYDCDEIIIMDMISYIVHSAEKVIGINVNRIGIEADINTIRYIIL